ncbi:MULTISPECIES: ParB N-terminal domain-containing protein [unclassified Micromonospora]|uniref:ParB/RepB/Spo0J family partition protein n=1 Tax=unclassified Micromonospora TaxID=2617518 RepID=UPI0022B60C85|nr:MULTISPECIES: ParB N-terminal domain-containing protein [unclassified Micromonospora]MCZ7421936.1 ParB N-terminal domain-containing protein [Verrucosispora sp. WMMA2121]WBB93329.1 ParB N-terminal domain-containing protein [Verrucosispora sp. WMMC514]
MPIGSLLPADSPRLDGENEEHIRRLAECAEPLPPIVVDRRTMKIVDGMHRYRSAQLTGAEQVTVRYFDGSVDDAFVLTVSLNTKHGLPLTRQDRLAATARILRTHAHLSDAALAGICGVSDKTVAKIRRQLFDPEKSGVEQRVGRDGRRRAVESGAARVRAAEIIRRNPVASLRQVAAAVRLSPSTVKDVRDRLARGEPPVPGRVAGPAPAPEQVRPADEALVRACLANLQSDPRVQQNHVGRFLLRLIRGNAIDPTRWEELADTVPRQWARPLSEVAGIYAAAWTRFSRRLAARSADPVSRSSL